MVTHTDMWCSFNKGARFFVFSGFDLKSIQEKKEVLTVSIIDSS